MLKLTIIILALMISNCVSQVCDKNNSVVITGGHQKSNGDIDFDGVTYNLGEYYTDENDTVHGCICKKKICILKCCPFGEIYDIWKKGCIKSTIPFNPPVLDDYMNVQNVNAKDYFHINTGKPECGRDRFRVVIRQVSNYMYLRNDGQLYIQMASNIPPWILRGPDSYCIDTLLYEGSDGTNVTQLDALVCFKEETVDESDYYISSTCMIISCVFILATVAVYSWLPELRNLHGRVLMAYLVCLFVGFACFATMQLLLIFRYISPHFCVGLSIIIYFSLLSAFFWLNVMCFDYWWTFSGNRGLTIDKLSARAKFSAYSCYAFGLPTLLTIVLLSLEYSGLPPHPLLPMIRQQGCFLFGKSKIIYFYGPIIILWFANLIFFILTAVKIAQIKQETSVLKSKESATHDNRNNDRQRLFLYVKLFIVMGINWFLEVLSTFFPEANRVWCFTDAYNVLTGLFVFIIFVCKRNIFRLMKKRIKEIIQRRKGQMGSMTHIGIRNQINKSLRDYKQRDSLDTIRTYCPDSDSNKDTNNSEATPCQRAKLLVPVRSLQKTR